MRHSSKLVGLPALGAFRLAVFGLVASALDFAVFSDDRQLIESRILGKYKDITHELQSLPLFGSIRKKFKVR